MMALVIGLWLVPFQAQSVDREDGHVEDLGYSEAFYNDAFVDDEVWVNWEYDQLEHLEYSEELRYDPLVPDDLWVGWEDLEDEPYITGRQARANVRLHQNWGFNRPVTTLSRVRNRAIGAFPNPPVRTGPLFVDWFTTAAASGGQRVRSNTIVPNVATWNLHARWTNPTRHLNFWTRPVNAGTTTINVRNFSYNNVWQPAMVRGITNWNGSAARVNFTRTANSNNRVQALQRNNNHPGALGALFPTRTGSNLTSFRIELYSISINDYARRNNVAVANVIESVMTHELGHAIGLRDGYRGSPLNGGRNNSIMNHDRQRWIRRTPANFDITSVNMIY